MDYLLGFFLPYILLYKYVALFIVVCVNAIIVPVPVGPLLLAVGAFSSQGYFNFWASLAVAQSANVLGDLFDYFLTRKYGSAIIRKFGVDKSRFFVQLEKYLRTHAGATIFITRFAGSLDPVVNFLSGLAGINFATFLFYDFIGNILEIGAVISLGYAVGSAWESFSGALSTVGSMLAVGIIMIVLIRMYLKRAMRRS